ncbi:hypothetical protein [Pleomorphomonas sp. PLEO]|uniref:hypothetical protein n=1 Tax=Pleomorphomonas sp. PLEO TaxID=3239306 RepID=UPI00351E6197
MANITPTAINNAGNELAWAASAPAGDVIIYRGGTLVVEFQNGHSSSITVSAAPTRTTAQVEGVGKVDVPTRSLVLAAGEPGIFVFTPDEISAYRNAAGNLPIAYASGNAALTVRAFTIN